MGLKALVVGLSPFLPKYAYVGLLYCFIGDSGGCCCCWGATGLVAN